MRSLNDWSWKRRVGRSGRRWTEKCPKRWDGLHFDRRTDLLAARTMSFRRTQPSGRPCSSHYARQTATDTWGMPICFSKVLIAYRACEFKPTVSSAVAEHHRHDAITETRVCERLARCHYVTANGQELEPRWSQFQSTNPLHRQATHCTRTTDDT